MALIGIAGVGWDGVEDRIEVGHLDERLADGRYLAYTGIISVSFAGLFAWISGCSFVLQQIYGLNPFEFGVAFGVSCAGYLVGTLIAAKLVMQAGTMGQGGVIFMLDMGEPVRIVDLARNLIELSGLRPNVDIDITFTGSAPVGWGIRQRAPRKRVNLELGNATPVMYRAASEHRNAAARPKSSGRPTVRVGVAAAMASRSAPSSASRSVAWNPEIGRAHV